MKITQELLDSLTAMAKASSRLRMNYDLRLSPNDQSHRMLKAIEPGSAVPIRRHEKSSETVSCVRGRVAVDYFNEVEGRCIEEIELSPAGHINVLSIRPGQWFSFRSLESGTVVLDIKDGPYEEMGKEVPEA